MQDVESQISLEKSWWSII